MRPTLITTFLLAGLLGLGCANAPWTQLRDPISAGTAKLFLTKGETTQSDVIEAFGGPNIVAGDADGNETWTYDRMTYANQHRTGGGFGGGGGIIGSVPIGGLLWGSASRGSSSSRTVTLLLHWKDGVLTDYRYRSASF